MDFTFCAFTYNQRDLILQQLESIKYQIENYGEGVECHFLLADDCSTDGTPDIVSAWLEENQHLFKSVRLPRAEKNLGIVGNYVNALRNIETEYFKITAGDDFYYKNNVFEVYRDANLVISPVVYYGRDNRVIRKSDRFLKKLIRFGDSSEKIKKFTVQQYAYGGGILAPGVFMKKELIDEGLYEALRPYSWIEDAPEFFYLMQQESTRVRIHTAPLVVYRSETGISTGNKNENYLRDREYLLEHIHTRFRSMPRYRNPYMYKKYIEREIYTLPSLAKKSCRCKTRELRRNLKAENEAAEEYIRMITDCAAAFEKEH